MEFNILSFLILLPLLGAALIMLFSHGDEAEQAASARYIALGTTIATFVGSLFLWGHFNSATDAFQFVPKT